MGKKRRSMLLNLSLLLIIFVLSFFIMGAYDNSCPQPLVITTGSLPEGAVNESYNATASAAGGTTPYTWSATNLPSGLSFDSSTGTISGIPIQTTTDQFNVTLTVTDAVYANNSVSLGLKINPELALLTSSLNDGLVNTSYSDTVTASGGVTPYTWSATGLPDGLDIDVSTGEIYGTPTETGSFNVALEVTDAAAYTKNKSLTLSVNSALAIQTSSLQDGTVGDSYSTTITAVGGKAPYTWSATGLPDGLGIDAGTGVISGIPTMAGTYMGHITVQDNNMITVSKDLSLRIKPKHRDSEHSAPVQTPSQPPAPSQAPTPPPVKQEPMAGVLGIGGNLVNNIGVNLDKGTGLAAVQITDTATLNSAYSNAVVNAQGTKTIEIEIPKVDGASGYSTTLPAEFMNSGNGNKAIEIKTTIGSVTVSDNMLSTADISRAKSVSLAITAVDKSKLDQAVQAQIGSRPVIDLSLSIDGKQAAWNNENAPVTVSIPYTPTEIELNNPEHITVWYIDGSGNAVAIPNGMYDHTKGCVTFTTTHFSKYAIAFVQKTFDDIKDYSWAKNEIEIMAAKGILSGTTETKFNPSGNVTRADFIVMLTKTLGLNAKVDSNFSDVRSDAAYYEAVGIAKKLGIVKGSDKNLFHPDEPITRQDMLVLTERALSVLKHSIVMNDTSNLDSLTDKNQISAYAKKSVSALMSYGLVDVSGGKIAPLSNVTRAEVAVFLYRVYNKY